jgi:hypothetical protein
LALTAPALGAAPTQPAENNDLVYIAPLHKSGSLNYCQAALWYLTVGTDIYVCVGSKSQHAQTASDGSCKAELTFGDFTSAAHIHSQNSKGIMAEATIVQSEVIKESVLERLSQKYRSVWHAYGRTLEQGLANGSKTLLKYRLTAG